MFDAMDDLANELVELAEDLQSAIEDEDIGESSHVAIQLRVKLKEITSQLAEIEREED